MAWHGKELRSRIQACGKSQGTAVHSPALGLCLHCSTDPWCVPALFLQGSGAPDLPEEAASPPSPGILCLESRVQETPTGIPRSCSETKAGCSLGFALFNQL